MGRISAPPTVILCLLLLLTLREAATAISDHISINCGSNSASTAVSGKEWMPDAFPKFSSAVILRGSSTTASVSREATISVDPVPYRTARISRSQFSYSFRLNPGQKFIRLHFNPSLYDWGFKRLDDFFTVEAGPFILLTNFSASITAHALGVNAFVKEFCVIIQENQLLDLVFSPANDFYAFINGIEIISVPSGLSYCHDGDVGVQIVGQNSMVYIGSATALEMVHRLNVKKDDSISSTDDFRGMFRTWATAVRGKGDKANDDGWRISVDVGFRYLVRLHFCEAGLKMAEIARKDFMILINRMIALTSADVVGERQEKGILWYKNYMVMMTGNKREGKRDIVISLHSVDEFLERHSPLEGFEIFKLSNHDNSLASPNPLPPTRDLPSWASQDLLAVFGPTNVIVTVFIVVICLVNTVVYKLRKNWEANFTEEENMPSTTRAKKLCRRFSFSEIQSATDNFSSAFVIGRGGFGKVYKGRIDNGKETVAIKRLKTNSKQGKREFWMEIETLSELRHVNLVSLVGYCRENREMILVYDYMPCGSLADHLYKLARKDNSFSSLSWKQRLKICIEAGRGIEYLHTGQGIIHRDIKASNILLDENFVAKVSDFGLAKNQSESNLRSQDSLKGTFGYFDPDYFRTRKLTMKSDTYSFGVMLLEVLCGRPAVEPWVEEDKRSLTMWARDSISKGEVDQIVAPDLSEEISPGSLKAFVRIVEKCLHDDPKKRPTIAHILINLEFALEQQENVNSVVPNRITSMADVLPLTDNTQPENLNFILSDKIANTSVFPQKETVKFLLPNEVTDVADAMPCTDKILQANTQVLSPTEITNVTEAKTQVLSPTQVLVPTVPAGTRQLTGTSSNVQNFTSPFKEQVSSQHINAGRKDGIKTTMHKLSRLWPWNSTKPSKKKHLVSVAVSAPISYRNSNMNSRGSSLSENKKGGSNELISTPNLRIFSIPELKAATRNFSPETVLGEGGYGPVYKGLLIEKSSTKKESTAIAVKRLSSNSMQGHKEWLAEVNYLGRLSHPNLVKLLGYCLEAEEKLLIYEFMQNNSLDYHLFRRGVKPLQWDIRVKILIGAARALAFLHSSERPVIYRDFKAANILLDGSYHAKLSDFGISKDGPEAMHSHVTTRVMGTNGYAAPEYVATGHLTVKCDVYGFGVVLVETLSGLRVIDMKRASDQQYLVEWIKPNLSSKRKLARVIDPRLEGIFPARCVFEIAKLALSCLQIKPNDRPSSQEIVETLERNEA